MVSFVYLRRILYDILMDQNTAAVQHIRKYHALLATRLNSDMLPPLSLSPCARYELRAWYRWDRAESSLDWQKRSGNRPGTGGRAGTMREIG